MGSSEEVKERERDADGTEMPKASRAALIEVMEYLELEAQRRKSSAMASGRERDVVGEKEEKDEGNQIEEYLNQAWMLIKFMEEKDEVNQIEEYLNMALKALPLIKICKERTAMSSAVASGRTQIQAPESDTKDLQLRLSSSLPDIFYTGETKLGSEIHVELIDNITRNVVTSGPESRAKLNVVVVKGNFDNNDRTREAFRSHVVTDRAEKKLLTGAVELFLENGVALLPVPTFTDNSSWIPNRKIRLGVEVASGFCEGIRVGEAISNPFVVIDRRGKGNEKHYPPAPDDEIWRLRNIGRNGPFHRRLNAAGISYVRHFLWKLDKYPQGLMEILETKMAPGRWDDLVNHARTCVLSGKYYVYYADHTNNFGVVFENVFESCGLIEGGEYYSAENLSDSQKVSVETLIRAASDNKCDGWKSIEEYHIPDTKPRKRARISPTDVATGAHTDQQVREPAIGDPSVSCEQQVHESGQSPSEEQGSEVVRVDPMIIEMKGLTELELFDGSMDRLVDWDSMFLALTTEGEPPAPYPPNLADGANELSVEDYDVAIDMNPSEREHCPSTDTVTSASENFGNNQASRDQALVNQRLDVGDPAVPFDQQAPAPCQATFRSFPGQVDQPFYPEEKEATEEVQVDQPGDFLEYSTDGIV